MNHERLDRIDEPAVLTNCEVYPANKERDVDDENELKVIINTFVWMHAPAAMPLGKADELACLVFEAFVKARTDYK